MPFIFKRKDRKRSIGGTSEVVVDGLDGWTIEKDTPPLPHSQSTSLIGTLSDASRRPSHSSSDAQLTSPRLPLLPSSLPPSPPTPQQLKTKKSKGFLRYFGRSESCSSTSSAASSSVHSTPATSPNAGDVGFGSLDIPPVSSVFSIESQHFNAREMYAPLSEQQPSSHSPPRSRSSRQGSDGRTPEEAQSRFTPDQHAALSPLPLPRPARSAPATQQTHRQLHAHTFATSDYMIRSKSQSSFSTSSGSEYREGDLTHDRLHPLATASHLSSGSSAVPSRSDLASPSSFSPVSHNNISHIGGLPRLQMPPSPHTHSLSRKIMENQDVGLALDSLCGGERADVYDYELSLETAVAVTSYQKYQVLEDPRFQAQSETPIISFLETPNRTPSPCPPAMKNPLELYSSVFNSTLRDNTMTLPAPKPKYARRPCTGNGSGGSASRGFLSGGSSRSGSRGRSNSTSENLGSRAMSTKDNDQGETPDLGLDFRLHLSNDTPLINPRPQRRPHTINSTSYDGPPAPLSGASFHSIALVGGGRGGERDAGRAPPKTFAEMKNRQPQENQATPDGTGSGQQPRRRVLRPGTAPNEYSTPFLTLWEPRPTFQAKDGSGPPSPCPAEDSDRALPRLPQLSPRPHRQARPGTTGGMSRNEARSGGEGGGGASVGTGRLFAVQNSTPAISSSSVQEEKKLALTTTTATVPVLQELALRDLDNGGPHPERLEDDIPAAAVATTAKLVAINFPISQRISKRHRSLDDNTIPRRA